jgi:hypothetical protein
VLLGEGDGRFQPSRLYRANSRPMALAAADLNRDGVTDLAVANNFSNDVSILLAIPPPAPPPAAPAAPATP